ncbi:hypothetical protein AMS68_001825 [Peltaster fructicola]|uniref:Fibronectin type-III domain-containing protein n=1 Tax=Peltaster fructicola TaxID=286661 RepID=A0A6H0XNV4_9PEZI|nr:hypothetical protein AMS68_001825 [Peltaster fructicola]
MRKQMTVVYAWSVVAIIAAHGAVLPPPPGSVLSHELTLQPSYIHNYTSLHQSLARDSTDDGDDDEDLSDLVLSTPVGRLAALGDSYSAGIGAGDRLGSFFAGLDDTSDFSCSRYDHSYPYLLSQDLRLGDLAKRNFQFLSCSGAVSKDVIEKQLPRLEGNQDVILLSAGGNDVELVNILNQCVFQWTVFRPDQAILGTIASLTEKFDWAKNFDWSTLSRGCEGQLQITEALIQDPSFQQKIERVIAGARLKLASGGVIYYTGYAKFFSETLDSTCDTVSWSTWIYKLWDMFGEEAFLTLAHRQKMNYLVDLVNTKLASLQINLTPCLTILKRAAVANSGPDVVFVDYDPYVGQFHGRFCEAGVDESTVESTTRAGLMFYELNTWDPFGSSPWKRSERTTSNTTMEGQVNIFALITLEADKDAQLKHDAAATNDKTISDSVSNSKDIGVPTNIMPDGYGRVFHPTILLHEIIADLIVYHLRDKAVQLAGHSAIPESLTFSSCPLPTKHTSNTTGSDNQQIAIASYINPIADPAAWDRLIAYDSTKVPVLVANVLNGPDAQINTAWKGVIDRAVASGKKVIAYVRTGYLGVSQQRFTTRLGSTDLADWVDQIEQDVEKWYELYGDAIGGIFFDEGWNDCGPNNIYADLYAFINRNTKRRHPGAFTVLNPGATMPECFDATMDALMTFESSYEQYTQHYTPNNWIPSDSRKIWHIVYNVPQSEIGHIAQLAKDRHAGLLQITDRTLPNPYDKLPDDAYLQTIFGYVPGGKPNVAQAGSYPPSAQAGAPGNLQVVSSEYTSAKLSWSAAPNANGYRVYVNERVVDELPSTMTSVTVGMLKPGTSGYGFKVTSLSDGGNESPPSNVVSADTTPLPGGRNLVNMKQSANGTYDLLEVDILIPAAFERIFICTPDGRTPAIGWGVRWSDTLTRWCPFMVEGQNWYKKIGNNGDWSWDLVQTGTPGIDGYHRTWGVPPGTRASLKDPSIPGSLLTPNIPSTAEATWIIQTEGYSPLTNVFVPCPGVGASDDPGRYC